MSTRRGKKINPAKNAGSAREFAAGKKIGRPKQRWNGTGWEKYVEESAQSAVLTNCHMEVEMGLVAPDWEKVDDSQ